MDQQTAVVMSKYGKLIAQKNVVSRYTALKHEDGIIITLPQVDCANLTTDDLMFVNDKNVDKLDGNFKSAAVILYCALRQDKKLKAAAIIDSDAILEYSSQKKPLLPILDDLAQVCGISIKSAAQNNAAEVVSAISGLRNSCLLPYAGAVVTGRTLDEVYTAATVLDKACNAQILAQSKGGTQSMSKISALLEHVVYKVKYSKHNQQQQTAAESGKEASKDQKPSAIVTDEEVKIATDIKNCGERMLADNLVQGTWGNIAVKLDDATMLATPSGIDYVMLQPQQIAKVDLKTLKWSGSHKATSERGIHAALLGANDGTTATIHTHPFYGCILAAMAKPLPVPEEYRDVLGEEIPCAEAALPGTSKIVKNTLAAIGDAPACFLAHHGVIVRGKDLDSAYQICKTLELACERYLKG